ncbi:MAG: hypothetical protein ABJQ70_05800 [Roseobacter sp.]
MSEGLTAAYEPIPLFHRGDGVATRHMVGKGNSEMAPFTTGTTVFPAGCAASLHSHTCSEQVTILEGSAEAMIDGHITHLRAMDATFILAQTLHFFEVPAKGN